MSPIALKSQACLCPRPHLRPPSPRPSPHLRTSARTSQRQRHHRPPQRPRPSLLPWRSSVRAPAEAVGARRVRVRLRAALCAEADQERGGGAQDGGAEGGGGGSGGRGV
eukprot:1938053-Pleurochrysis_carterae.AAC.2